MSAPVIVYGASGYTGKLIAAHLAQYGIPFIAAGRSRERLEEQMAKVPELAGAAYEIVAVDHDEAALTELFTGATVVYNVTGPFMQLGEPVVAASLAAGAHYLDTTGEADWMAFIRDKFGAAFAAKGLLLCPAASYMWAAGNLAAEIALETPGIDSLDILYLADSSTSVASTKSFLRMCTKPQYYLEHNELVMWPYATAYDVRSPDQHRIFKALPWSGGGEALWYLDDPRVTNCTTLVGFKNQQMFGGVLKVLEEFEEKYRELSYDEQEEVTNALGAQITETEPDREDPDRNRSVISCVGRGNMAGVTVVMRGNSPYLQTGALAAEAAKRLIGGKLLAAGFQSPAKAFGARNIVNAWAELGYHAWEASRT
ncbi:saccharopine dehydrogenase family protein [Sphingopyxis alaskensis]|jgi:hypothetical protein|uniref:saccharopine dehydrogenase family protein n=1 Tax=Sphingopyxis alaskensis TaxID=117207 RepID=UPI00203A66C2|nr:DUF5938 domain-containing protein [Sphingopyxis alaskensis]MCM3419777.1 DUF5938 domain-containing protein [Sphingopyxis alaskensis]